MSTSPQPDRPSKAARREQARAERVAREQAEAAAATRKRRLLMLGGVLAAAAVVVVVAILVSSSGSSGPKTAALQSGETVPGQKLSKEEFDGIKQSAITLGDPKAPVTLVEFADLKCPICREYSAQSLPQYLEKYVRTGKVKMEFRVVDFVGGEDSSRAAVMVAAAAQQNRLWNFVDLFYRNQGDETEQYVNDAFLTKIGRGVPGLDVGKALAARTDAASRRQIAESTTLIGRYGVNSTPTFLIGTNEGDLRKIDNEQTSFQALGPVIDAELAKAT